MKTLKISSLCIAGLLCCGITAQAKPTITKAPGVFEVTWPLGYGDSGTLGEVGPGLVLSGYYQITYATPELQGVSFSLVSAEQNTRFDWSIENAHIPRSTNGVMTFTTGGRGSMPGGYVGTPVVTLIFRGPGQPIVAKIAVTNPVPKGTAIRLKSGTAAPLGYTFAGRETGSMTDVNGQLLQVTWDIYKAN